MQIKNNKMGKGNKSVSQVHPIMKHMSNSAFRQEGVAQEKKDLMKDMPVDKDATSRGSMKKDGVPKHGQPFHAYGKPMSKLGYKE
jgi:hypothetical protein